ncbi:hypothetical protein ACIPSE_15910 [Streptomyces sp. NPDC090106]|uniref:hypothetical protein n=1 Tax=Streptomyces sp. NPDC090106 TaxID=3365946 RepID=UPI00382F4215
MPTAAAVAVAAVLTAVLPGPPALAAGTPSPYGYAPDVRTVTGAESTTDAEPLDPGETYRSILPADGERSYRLTLDDASSDAYVAVTALPRAGTTLSSTDGIRVSLEDADGGICDTDSTLVGPSRDPHPFVASVARESTSRRTACAGEGPYYVVVGRTTVTGAAPGDWDLELTPVLEPGLREPGPTEAPRDQDSSSPDPLTGQAVRRAGGAGFSDAEALAQGVWSTGITPGGTLFYSVPVDWGQRIHVTAELGGGATRGRYVTGALTLSLHNPARVPVEDLGLGYDGRPQSRALASLPPVEYANRNASAQQINGMRVAGSYYLAVHLSDRVAEEYGDGALGVTLRVRVDGAVEAAPEYVGPSRPRGLFEVAGHDEAVAAGGGGGQGGGADDTAMKVVAVAGIGGGTVLLAGLAAWTVAARRRGRAGV